MSQRLAELQAKDLSRLKLMMGKVLESDVNKVRRALQKKEESRVLDIACGAAHEAEALTDFLADLKGSGGAKIKFTGIDIRAREISDAQRTFGKRKVDHLNGVEKEFEFLTGDATRLNGHGQLGEDFDLVFLRHQNFWNGKKTWEEIFDHALSKLGDEGRLVITSYFDKEHELALEAIQRLGGKLICTEANLESRELPTPGKSIDRHVAVFQREPGPGCCSLNPLVAYEPGLSDFLDEKNLSAGQNFVSRL